MSKRFGDEHTDVAVDKKTKLNLDSYEQPRLPLAIKHSHPRDEDIYFRDADHTYILRKKGELMRAQTSASSVASKFFPPFDADEIIGFMMGGKNWLTSDYYRNYWIDEANDLQVVMSDIHENHPTQLIGVIALWISSFLSVADVEELVHSLHPIQEYIRVTRILANSKIQTLSKKIQNAENKESDDLETQLEKLLSENHAFCAIHNKEYRPLKIASLEDEPKKAITYIINQYRQDQDADKDVADHLEEELNCFGKSFDVKSLIRDHIKEKWTTAGQDASSKGTAMHECLEKHINGFPIPENMRKLPEIRQYLEMETMFIRFHNLEYYRTEWMLHTDEDFLLCGTADLICVPRVQNDPDVLHLWILDHKRSKEIKKSGGKQGLGPCSKLKANNYTKYSLAMSFYAHMLETYYKDLNYNGHVYKQCKIDRMYLDVCHPNQVACNIIEVEDYKDIVREIVETFRIANQ